MATRRPRSSTSSRTEDGRRRVRAPGCHPRQIAAHFEPTKWGEVESVALPGVTAVPAAIKTLDVNQDGQTDLLDLQGLRSASVGPG